MRRIGAMSELQNLATFLMADGCEWLTGETIAIDGAGYLATGAYFTELDKMTDADWQKARDSSRRRTTRTAPAAPPRRDGADKLAPRPAATLLLLRDGSLGPEAFLLQRTQSAAFLAGAHVFPGGALDKADRDARVLRRVRGPRRRAGQRAPGRRSPAASPTGWRRSASASRRRASSWFLIERSSR